MLRIDIGSL
ncbi:hypothetical protein CISIN_1g0406972mg, partial [Citrus sinensis]